MKPPVRRIIRWLHLYIGLLIGILCAISGLTGSMMVYRWEIDQWLNPALLQIQVRQHTVSWDRVLAVAQEAIPFATVKSIRVPTADDMPYEVRLERQNEVVVYAYVNQYSGQFLGSREPGEGLIGTFYHLHTELLAGERGEVVIGISGIVLFVLVATGVPLWWRGLRRLKGTLTIAWRATWRRVIYDLHSVIGAYFTLPLLLICLSGAAMVFHDVSRPLVHAVMQTSAPLPAPTSIIPATPSSSASLESILRSAEAVLPAARITYITMPQKPEDVLKVRKRYPTDAHRTGRNFIYLDQYSGVVLRVDEARKESLGTRISDHFYPIHTGDFGGTVTRALFAATGLVPLLMLVTGVLMWSRRKRRRQRASGQGTRRNFEEIDESTGIDKDQRSEYSQYFHKV